VLTANPAPAEYTGPNIDRMLLVVLPVPVVVLWDKPMFETAWRMSVPVEIKELVPNVLPDI
jgi:hypothetical protein